MASWDNNVDKLKHRNELALSNAMRDLVNTRMLDVDGIIWSPDYSQAFAVIEATSSPHFKPTTATRKIAKALGAFAILLRHAFGDDRNQGLVRVTIWGLDGRIQYEDEILEWEEFKTLVDETIPEYFATEVNLKK